MTDLSREGADVRNRARGVGIPLIGASQSFLNLLRSVDRAVRHNTATVLIRGETGTGKELIARAIHYLGARRECPFIPVNCGALAESLTENELFGHRQGAFTGASHEAPGLLRLAHRGTLFLDEVDSLPAKAQVALLRFLEDGRFRPLGAGREEQVSVRVVAAANTRLDNDVRAGRFRQDLYYRLGLFVLEVPPLRARAGDIEILSLHFLQQCAEQYECTTKRLHAGTASWFEEYGWPGNVRELENLIHREFLLADGDELHIKPPSALPARLNSTVGSTSEFVGLSYKVAKARALQDFDRSYLTQLMRRAQGNVTRAAQLAGKERRALGKLLKRYHIGGPTEGKDSSSIW